VDFVGQMWNVWQLMCMMKKTIINVKWSIY